MPALDNAMPPFDDRPFDAHAFEGSIDTVHKAVIFEDVFISFEDIPVLEGVSFELKRGETKVILGVSGSGKSTILKLSLGLLKPDSGRIYVLGHDVTTMTEEELFELRSKVGIVFQESALFDSLTVRDNVAFRLMEEHLPEAEVEKRVRESLSFVELEAAIDKFPAELSGGMRRRVGIARAIITQPEVLLYDSPTGGLDPITSTTIIELIMKQRDVFKTSALMVTHRLQDGFTLATHYFDPTTKHMKPSDGMPSQDIRTSFMILREGKAVFEGSAHELGQVQDPYIKEYIS
jgi:phospholipid/cholesterol/gamma-HCH transport system ATP-binding protein